MLIVDAISVPRVKNIVPFSKARGMALFLPSCFLFLLVTVPSDAVPVPLLTPEPVA